MNAALSVMAVGALMFPSIGADAKPVDDQVTIGAAPPPMSLDTVLQGPPPDQVTWDALKDHVVVLELWTTWCSPCVAAIPHLNELVEEFKGEPVRFISITNEEESVIRAFLQQKTMKGWVALDTDKSMFDVFSPTGSVPVTVVIDRKGKIAALTYPTAMTATVIRAMLKGEAPDVPQMARPVEPPDREEIRAQRSKGAADEQTPQSLVEVRITPIANDSGGMHSWRPGRMEARGWTVEVLLARAYDVPGWRVIVPKDIAEQRYEIVVAGPGEWDSSVALLDCAVNAAFPGVRREAREADVYVLEKISEGHAPGLEPTSLTDKSGQIGSSGWMSFVNRDMAALTNWLADTLGRPVLDETGLSGRFDMYIKYDEKNAASLLEVLPKRLGLRLTPARREVEFVVLGETADVVPPNGDDD